MSFDNIKVRESPCKWVGCPQERNREVNLELVEEGAVVGTYKINVCNYHFYVTGAGHFQAVHNSSGKVELSGNFAGVSLIEAVMGAREMVRVKQPQTAEEIKSIRASRG